MDSSQNLHASSAATSSLGSAEETTRKWNKGSIAGADLRVAVAIRRLGIALWNDVSATRVVVVEWMNRRLP
jgi:hypothetical protein